MQFKAPLKSKGPDSQSPVILTHVYHMPYVYWALLTPGADASTSRPLLPTLPGASAGSEAAVALRGPSGGRARAEELASASSRPAAAAFATHLPIPLLSPLVYQLKSNLIIYELVIW